MQKPSTFSLDKKQSARATLDATAVSALGAVDTSTTVAEVLDILSAAVKASHVVTEDSIGRATTIEA